MKKCKITLNICGADYVIASDYTEVYMREVGCLVDEKMKKIIEMTPTLSISRAAVLTALDFCDYAENKRELIENLRNQIKENALQLGKINQESELLKNKIHKLEADLKIKSNLLKGCEKELQKLKFLDNIKKVKENYKDITTFALENDEAMPDSDIF